MKPRRAVFGAPALPLASFPRGGGWAEAKPDGQSRGPDRAGLDGDRRTVRPPPPSASLRLPVLSNKDNILTFCPKCTNIHYSSNNS